MSLNTLICDLNPLISNLYRGLWENEPDSASQFINNIKQSSSSEYVFNHCEDCKSGDTLSVNEVQELYPELSDLYIIFRNCIFIEDIPVKWGKIEWNEFSTYLSVVDSFARTFVNIIQEHVTASIAESKSIIDSFTNKIKLLPGVKLSISVSYDSYSIFLIKNNTNIKIIYPISEDIDNPDILDEVEQVQSLFEFKGELKIYNGQNRTTKGGASEMDTCKS